MAWPYLSDLHVRRRLEDEASRLPQTHCTGQSRLSHSCARGRQGVHMLPQTKAIEVSGCLWLHCVYVSAKCGLTPQPLTNFKIVQIFLVNRKIELSSFINLDDYSAWVAAN